MVKTYADIILPLAVSDTYTFEVPADLKEKLVIGKRVEVQFGAKRVYAGIVEKIYETGPLGYKTKPVLNILDEEPIITTTHLALWQWIANYYMCTKGEVMAAGLPSAFKLSSETLLLLHPNFDDDFSLLNEREYLIAEALTIQNEITIEDAREILQLKQVFYVIKGLLEKGVILVKEELVERYKPKLSSYVALHETYQAEAALKDLFEQLEKRAAKQLAVLMAYMQLTGGKNKGWLKKKELLDKAGASSGHFKSLRDKGIFLEEKRQVSRMEEAAAAEEVIAYELSSTQQTAYDQLKAELLEKPVVTLFGVTSSGKTQLYMQLIEEYIQQGKQVLYLLPEIALTTQMIGRLRKVFGHQIGVYHSKFNDQERIEIWQKVLLGEYKVVVGARSGVFLPFVDLGLVIVDEEHDHSFKQYDPAPRYHARDTAIYLAHLFKAKTILGSATPSLETHFNATKLHKYGIVRLTERYGGVKLPVIDLVDMREAALQKEVRSLFSNYLLKAIQQALELGEQVILFQNRRGYAPYFICGDCSWIPYCVQCDVSLTYHKYAKELRCHYCGFRHPLYKKCDECGGTDLRIAGFGTEKIEEEIQLFLPGVKTGRLDLETARSKKGFEKTLEAFQDQKIQILIGTQMVTKGLDFDNVSLVGILSADQLLSFPDFRASERGFQLMMQVSGRAGRRQKQGRVIIQSNNMDYPVLQFMLNQDYPAFINSEMHSRLRLDYPPFYRMIQVDLKHKDKEKVNRASFYVAKTLRQMFGEQLLGPTVPLVSFIRRYHIRQILIKLGRSGKEIAQGKQWIRKVVEHLKQHKDFKSVIVQINVDPY